MENLEEVTEQEYVEALFYQISENSNLGRNVDFYTNILDAIEKLKENDYKMKYFFDNDTQEYEVLSYHKDLFWVEENGRYRN
jgi:hypothetical protein